MQSRASHDVKNSCAALVDLYAFDSEAVSPISVREEGCGKQVRGKSPETIFSHEVMVMLPDLFLKELKMEPPTMPEKATVTTGNNGWKFFVIMIARVELSLHGTR